MVNRRLSLRSDGGGDNAERGRPERWRSCALPVRALAYSRLRIALRAVVAVVGAAQRVPVSGSGWRAGRVLAVVVVAVAAARAQTSDSIAPLSMSSNADSGDAADVEALAPPERKIEMAAPHKQRGNELFRQQKYAEAKKEYDDAFVCMFAGRDEFEQVYTDEQRRARNEYVVPLHLNRGLCKCKLGDFDAALWDFDEAQRLSQLTAGGRGNAKALYRRSRARMALARQELTKEGRKEFWDDDKLAEWLAQCRSDLRDAAWLAPQDRAIRDALAELAELERELKEKRRRAREKSKAMFSLMGRGGARRATGAADDEEEVEVDYSAMPPLERVRIDENTGVFACASARACIRT